jgi:stress-induced morphogen
MAMKSQDVKDYISRAIPGADIVLEALVADGDHYKVTVTAEAFRGLSRIQQHQMVMNAFEGRVGTELHALSIITKVPS